MREPNASDATLLLQLEGLRYNPTVDHAFHWAWTTWNGREFSPGTGNATQKAEAEQSIGIISTFFETAGVLVRDGLLHEDVFYDRYAVGAFWKLARDFNEKSRKDTGSSAMGENFEWLAAHEPEAQAHVDARHRRQDAERKKATA